MGRRRRRKRRRVRRRCLLGCMWRRSGIFRTGRGCLFARRRFLVGGRSRFGGFSRARLLVGCFSA